MLFFGRHWPELCVTEKRPRPPGLWSKFEREVLSCTFKTLNNTIVVWTESDGLCRRGDPTCLEPPSFTVAPTHTEVKRTRTHPQTILLHDLILYISWYVWYCGVNVLSCYDAVVRGLSLAIFGHLGGAEEVQYHLLARLGFRGESSPRHLSLVRLVTDNSKMLFHWKWSQAHSWLFCPCYCF